MIQIRLIRGLVSGLLLLLLPNTVMPRGDSFDFEQQQEEQQQQLLPFISYDDVIQYKRLIQSLPRTYDPTNPTETCYTPLYNSDISKIRWKR
jgi:hypothetical protein